MKLSLAIAFPLSLLAAAAPTPLKLKRDDGDSPSADVTSKVAYGSLKSVAQMMNMYNADDEATKDKAKAKANANANTNVPDYGNAMPINMTPNTMATFPGADGKPASDDETKGSQTPTPVEDAAASPSASAATSPSAAPSFTVGTPGAAKGGEDNEDVEDKQMQDSTPVASPSPSASAPAAPKKQSMLDGLPVLGSVAGLLGGV
ncbi:hypothetical protein BDW68DRAFT_178754 [Aspergillus falconensis]